MTYATRFSCDNPPNSRIGQRTVVVPLPTSRRAWFVWDSPKKGTIPDGPHDVVAIAYRQNWMEADAELSGGQNANGDPRPFEAVRAVESDAGNELAVEFTNFEIWFFVLPAKAAEWESLAIEQKYAYFDENAAHDAIARQVAARE